jgi:two-component system response regulator HydG
MASVEAQILVVDDSPATLEVVKRNLESVGYRVFTAGSVGDAIALLDQAGVDLVITDMRMPKVGGLDLLRHVRDNFPDTQTMVITGYATVENAVEAVKTGAEEYLAKPFTDDELFAAVERAIENLRLRREGRSAEQPTPHTLSGLIGESPAMQAVFQTIDKAASASATVLITGESGTGKELVAREIHYRSPRAAAPFVPVNCGGIPETLLESELFGHVKGAFTGATESRAGFFQTADGGTIFLDEVGEMSPAMQVKLLRVLQDGEVCMVGASKSRKVDVRVVAATNKDLRAMMKKQAFREDLFFRLNVIPIRVPPLRERGEDILLLVRHFARKYASEGGQEAPQFTEHALKAFRSYHWPGNVRELENIVHRLIVMAEGQTIDTSDLPELMRFSAAGDDRLHRPLAAVEAEHIRNVLASVGGNKTRAAEILGIDRKTLREKLRAESEP